LELRSDFRKKNLEIKRIELEDSIEEIVDKFFALKQPTERIFNQHISNYFRLK